MPGNERRGGTTRPGHGRHAHVPTRLEKMLMSFARKPICVVGLAICAALAAAPCLAQPDAIRQFRKEWADAKDFPLNQKLAIENISREMTMEAAKAITEVAFEKSVSYIASQAAFDALVNMRTQKILEWISEEVHKNKEWRIRAVLAKVLGKYADPYAEDGLLKALKDKKWEVRLAAGKALGNLPPNKRIIGALVGQVQKEQGRLVYELGDALEELTGAAGLEEAQDWKNWWNSHRDSWAPPKGTDKYGSPETARPLVGEPKTVVVSPIYGRIRSKKVIFVVDTSGSMKTKGEWSEGRARLKMSRLEIVKKELCKVLDTQIDSKCRFNIITFDETVRPWKKRPVKATAGSKASAKRFIRKLKPKGVTYTYGALMEAFANEDIDTIYFLSDGEPTHPPNSNEVRRSYILGKVKALNLHKSRIVHTIAFMVGEGKDFGFEEDKAKCAEFMQALAKSTGGLFKKID